MLHSSSSHYYACYYALLCLLYHQQQALAVTYVIDGATTNEWATKDEYQRLVDPNQGPLAAGGSGVSIGPTGRQHQQQQQHHAHPKQQKHQQATKLSDSLSNSNIHNDNADELQQPQQFVDQILRSISNGKSADNFRFKAPTSLPVSQRVVGVNDNDDDQRRVSQDELRMLTDGVAARRLIQAAVDNVEASSMPDESGNSNNQGNSFRNPTATLAVVGPALQPPASLLNDRDELEQALDRLDLIEKERKLQLKQMRQLDSLERAAETGVALALGHVTKTLGHQTPMANGDDWAHSIERTGARTLSDLVPLTDSDDFDDGSKPIRRDATFKRYCGDQLIDIVDLVCNHTVASSDQPQILDPVIKTKRSAYYNGNSNDDDDDDDHENYDNGSEARWGLDESANVAASSDVDGVGDLDSGSGRSARMPRVSRRRKLRTIQTGNLYEGDGEPSRRASSTLSSPLSSSSLSSSSSSSSSTVHDGNIGINNHNHNQQAKRYLSKSNFDKNDSNNNLNVMRKRQSRRAKLRRIRGIVKECCVNACTHDELQGYCGMLTP